jgi:quercetin 2,3-dioxygenase
MEPAAKIFLSEERGHTETDWFRSYCTFNFGSYQHDYKTPVDGLYLFNDETLAAGKSLNMPVETDSLLLLLPVVGAISYTDSTDTNTIIAPGQLHMVRLKQGSHYTITNRYGDGLVNFLQVRLQAPFFGTHPQPATFSFDINKCKNQLTCMGPHYLRFCIGKFDGRKDTLLHLPDRLSTAFAFVIQGAFEVNGVLLQPRDGLALWHHHTLDMEALSNEAIMVVVVFEPHLGSSASV